MVMRFLLVGGSTLRLRWPLMRPNWSILWQIMLLGVSPFIMKLTESLLSIAFNNQLYRFGGDLAVSVMTIMNSVWQMAQLMTHGFTDGAQPILGYNYGAGKLDRVRSAFRLELLTCWAGRCCAPWPCWPSPPCSCGCSPPTRRPWPPVPPCCGSTSSA